MLFERISFNNIIMDHLKTFHVYRDNKINIIEVFEYFLWPVIPTAIVLFVFESLSSELSTILTTFYSIFCGLLFSFIIVLQTEFRRFIETKETDSQQLVKETYSNASFSIVLSIIAISQLFIYEIIKQPLPRNVKNLFERLVSKFFNNSEIIGHYIKLCFSFFLEALIVYTSILFLLTLLIVVKRLYRICRPSL